jgi:hypothetical protein
MKKDPKKDNSPKCKVNNLTHYMLLGPYYQPPSIISSTYENFKTKLYVIGFYIQLLKCVALSPFGLLLNFNTPS